MKQKEKTSTKRNVPRLRFPEFQSVGEWEQRTGDLLFQPISNKDHTLDLPILAITQENGAIPRDLINYQISVMERSVESYKVVEQGDFIISLRSFQGGIEYSFYKGICSPAYIILRKIVPLVDHFYRYYFKTDKYIKSLNKNIEGIRDGKMVSFVQFSEILLPIPSLSEQQKIADCLSSLDEIISLESQKLKALQSYKKGLLQQLFPAEGETVPRLRFPEFKNAGEWEERSIQELIDSNIIIGHLDGNHGELYPRSDEFSESGIPYISANDFVAGTVDFSRCKHLPEQIARLFKKGVARSGDILFAHNATVGPVAKLETKLDFVILSTTATYFRCDNFRLINNFLQFALSCPLFVEQYTRVMKQSTRNQVPITTQRKLKLALPKSKEQQKIANCLSSIDELLTEQSQRLEELKLHKKGLLQQLFPEMGE
ncbi:restriction endonuclease subunit S [Leptospira licerasiae]|uniref:Type I restriction modification DNA specificity domain protein n=1 Tax=Leptospira licerasiae str. MMD4847 TaxID=1049971 RepID=A0ABP2RFH1_9LEPT|nr:restriction endonuclease subunit S [Leptospira licerasiae]EIE00559.1 type I restriction modification DNA specificity domain protein [Leptospira licerasiae serovar Varillal str. VAR 010]EJZ41123.1 type I restriction modification DNA specificity domain protein [Leptospira licerasiae str. MMD4847]